MKKILHKILILLTYSFSFLLLVSLLSSFISPRTVPFLSIASLIIFPLIIINSLFAFYWLLKKRSKFFISTLPLACSFFVFGSPYQFSKTHQQNLANENNQISLVSFNVRLFNAYESTSDSQKVSTRIASIINDQQPDIFCIQEYYQPNTIDFSEYPYHYIHFKRRATKLGHAIFSKYPILNQGAFDFENSNNNALYVDILKDKDTLRVYNLHLQSLRINPNINALQEENKDRLRKRISKTFEQQQDQVEKILKHQSTSKYPIILCGDFNNTSYSYIYRQLSHSMKDTFKEAGTGFGGTYLFDNYPIRIDFVLVSPLFKVQEFLTLNETFSDHFPIYSKLSW
ncbi:MAG: endonuclease/exonuclease/phosphatase family protein [Flavobacteriales bacterium]